jgi:hypothetical protein
MDTATPVGHPEASAAFTHSAAARSRWRLPRQARQTLLTAHIVVSVGLLGDTVGYLTIAARAATDDDPAAMRQSAHILNLFSMLFGIPLSFAALLTGIGLGLGTRWGVLRHPWVVAKLALVLSVLLVGGVWLGPASNDLLDGVDRTRTLVIAATYDVIALTTATALSVFKPGGPFRRTTQTRATG